MAETFNFPTCNHRYIIYPALGIQILPDVSNVVFVGTEVLCFASGNILHKRFALLLCDEQQRKRI
jgi:hypothetical protein